MKHTGGKVVLRDMFGANRYELAASHCGRTKKPFTVVCPGGGYACKMNAIQ